MTVPCHTDTPALQRILSILSQQEGLTARQISGLAYVSERTLTCGGYLKTLRTAGLIYIAGWTQTLQGGLAALYSAGRQPDQPRTKVARQSRHSDRFERIVRLLEERGPLGYREVAAALGLAPEVVKNARYMNQLVEQNRIHIAYWRRSKAGPMQAVFAPGPGISAHRPAPFSRAEVSRRSREKKRVLRGPLGLAEQLAILHTHSRTRLLSSA